VGLMLMGGDAVAPGLVVGWRGGWAEKETKLGGKEKETGKKF